MLRFLTPSDGLRARADVYAAALAFLVPLAVYLRTMAPTVYGLDSAELTTGAYALGIVHSPGAPTYMLLGHLFSRIPIGDVGYRLNLLSVFCGAATVAIVYRIARELRTSITAALTASGLLAFSFYFWAWALVAELYAPHAFFASAVLLQLLRWRRTRRAGFLPAAAFLFGLGCGNHTAMVLLIPGFAWLALTAKPIVLRQPGLTAAASLCGLIGLSVYAYLPVRQAAFPPLDYVSTYFPGVDLGTPSGLLWMVRGGMFESLFFCRPLAALPGQGLRFLHVLASNFTLLGAGLALLGCRRLYAREKAVSAAFLLLFLAHSAFFLTYGARDRHWMYSVSYIMLALWGAVGIDHAGQMLRKRFSRVAGESPVGAAVATVFLLLAINWPKLDLSHDCSARDLGVLLASKMGRNAVFIGQWEHVPILEYLQVVEGWRTDVTLHNAVFLEPRSIRGILERAAAEGRPVYASHPRWVSFGDVDCYSLLTNNLCRATLRPDGKGG